MFGKKYVKNTIAALLISMLSTPAWADGKEDMADLEEYSDPWVSQVVVPWLDMLVEYRQYLEFVSMPSDVVPVKFVFVAVCSNRIVHFSTNIDVHPHREGMTYVDDINGHGYGYNDGCKTLTRGNK